METRREQSADVGVSSLGKRPGPTRSERPDRTRPRSTLTKTDGRLLFFFFLPPPPSPLRFHLVGCGNQQGCVPNDILTKLFAVLIP